MFAIGYSNYGVQFSVRRVHIKSARSIIDTRDTFDDWMSSTIFLDGSVESRAYRVAMSLYRNDFVNMQNEH